jgi:uncharacterized protein
MTRAPYDGDPREVLEVDWMFFGELCRALALRIAHDYDPDVVIGIAKAGVLPGAVVASILRRDFAAMSITRRKSSRRPQLVAGPPEVVRGRRVLIVDETCDTGDTLKVAMASVRSQGPAEVRTAVSFKTGQYEPDYHALATENFIVLPWDREVVEDGRLIVRPEYAAWLGASASREPDADF